MEIFKNMIIQTVVYMIAMIPLYMDILKLQKRVDKLENPVKEKK